MGELLERQIEPDRREQGDTKPAGMGARGSSAIPQDTDDATAQEHGFPYDEAFSRNIGWVTRDEQRRLRTKRVAIAGLGGAGGVHLLTLARLGIGKFRVADFDTFDFANFNRQVGATVSSIGQPKSRVLEDMARDINPSVELVNYTEGLTSANLDAFLDGVDLYVDALDFFAFDARAMVFAACERKGIPAITVAPLGMGAALLNFLPGGMSFESYFRWEGCDETEKALRFMVGLSPSFLHTGYLVDPSAVDFWARKGPSTGMACQLCAGVAGTEALKILLGRGKVLAAPWGMHFDAYRNTLKRTWRPGGNANPIQRLALRIARRRFASVPGAPGGSNLPTGRPGATPAPASNDPEPGKHGATWRGRPLESYENLLLNPDAPDAAAWLDLIDAARWAPSGDNTQPWRFEVVTGDHLRVHGFDTRTWCVYDIDGIPSRIALGAMLETLRIAAAEQNQGLSIHWVSDQPSHAPIVDVFRMAPGSATATGLAGAIRTRSVQRRAMSPRALSPDHKRAIERAVAGTDGAFECIWLESLRDKVAIARILSASSYLRMTLEETHETHVRVIEWGAKTSATKIPDQAIGLDPLTLRLMRWVMRTPRRALTVARYFGGTWAPRFQLDWIPGLASSAHLAIVPVHKSNTGKDVVVPVEVALGSAVQRGWLTAEQHGIRMQPEMAAPIFAAYGRRHEDWLAHAGRLKAAQDIDIAIARRLDGRRLQLGSWLCRVGYGLPSQARSTRRSRH